MNYAQSGSAADRTRWGPFGNMDYDFNLSMDK